MTTLTNRNNGVRRMQERFKRRSINFGLSQWLIKDLSFQQAGVRGDPQEGTNPSFNNR
jgi:hypothetical protein